MANAEHDLEVLRQYAAWRQRYSGEDFDRTQRLAHELTDDDRRDGKPAPAHGYSAENFTTAERIVRAARKDV
jgi:hypothetical protein